MSFSENGTTADEWLTNVLEDLYRRGEILIIKKRNNIFNGLDLSNIYIVTDFDGTLTISSSDSSWASIFKNPNVSKEFVQECIKIFNKYHPLEIDESMGSDIF